MVATLGGEEKGEEMKRGRERRGGGREEVEMEGMRRKGEKDQRRGREKKGQGRRR